MGRKGWTGAILAIACSSLGVAATGGREQPVADWADVLNLGATFSVYSYGQAPYNRSPPFLTFEERVLFSNGADAFTNPLARNPGTASGPSPTASGNAPSCQSCHFRDGRGRTHSDDFGATGFSVVNRERDGSPPVFRRPAASDAGAARLTNVRWAVEDRIVLPGGETVELVRPVAIVDGVERAIDLRNAPAVYGLGLLESIPDRDIIAAAQARPYERFGISGLVPVAADSNASMRVGRFGWKGTFATLPGQVRNAMATELGLVGRGLPDGSGPENAAFAALVANLTDYLRLLAVPARRLGREGSYRRGASLFAQTGCAMCHVPSQRTGQTSDLPAPYRNLTIFPFTDMLLHDMGAGLSDLSSTKLSRHWRTASLWGIGVQHGVSPEVGFLHDGRARTFAEAILWHGGEARYAVDRFRRLTPGDRAELIAFLASL
jgi:CxxC motif-containing protein (DUF1111 family)